MSVYKGANGIQALLKSNARKLAEQDESTLVASGIPYTMIRAGSLQNSPGGTQGFSFEQVLFNAKLFYLSGLVLGVKSKKEKLMSKVCLICSYHLGKNSCLILMLLFIG